VERGTKAVTEVDFTALLARVKAGDAAAMSRLFAMFNPKLVRFLVATDAAVAEDLASEVWMTMIRGVQEFAGSSTDFRVWMFSIARRRASEQRRRDTRKPCHPHDATHFIHLPGGDDPAALVIAEMTGDDAAAFVAATLPPDQAQVVVLRVLLDLDVSEVATVMGRSANWVRVTQHRALRRLADRLGSTTAVVR